MGNGANQTFYSAAKNAKFSVFKTSKMAVAVQNTPRPSARPENYCESKQTYSSYSFDKAFHSSEFKAKLFFTRNWVGGFYWDSPLRAQIACCQFKWDSEGDLSPVMLKEIFHDSLKLSNFTKICMENHSSVTGWQKLFSSYKSFSVIFGGRCSH